jgi:hypothetical protein
MRFFALPIAFLVSLAFASPAPVPAADALIHARDSADTSLIAELMTPSDSCNPYQCITVINAYACVLNSVTDLAKMLACFGGTTQTVSIQSL